LNHNIIDIPLPLTYDNGWFAGFFDADGTINFSFKNKHPQLTISVTNKYKKDIIYFQQVFGGYIYYDRSQNDYYKWTIQKKSDILQLLDYFKKYPSRSSKNQRLHLIPTYYKLVELRTYLQPKESAQGKAWLKFINRWQ